MTEQYFIDCVCGSRLTVELFDAGTSKTCQKCRATVSIPSSLKLQQSAGETSPYLSAIQKLRRAVSLREPPFDGACHACQTSQASVFVPITLRIMDERHVAHDDVVRPTITGGVKFVVAAAVEHWAVTVFPLMLCECCRQQFRRAEVRNSLRRNAMRCGMAGLAVAGIYFAWNNDEHLAWIAAITWLAGALIWAFRSTNTKSVDSFALKWLTKIRWVPDILAAEDEFKLTIGTAQSIDEVAS